MMDLTSANRFEYAYHVEADVLDVRVLRKLASARDRIVACLRGVTDSSGSPYSEPRRNFTSTKTRVSPVRRMRSISPYRVR